MQTKKKMLRSAVLTGVFMLLLIAQGAAQQMNPMSGRIVGRVIDSATGEGIPAVIIQVVGTRVIAVSGDNGRFVLPNVPVGRLVLRASSIGYGAATVADLDVANGGVVEQNIQLETQAIAIDALEVTGAAARGSVNRALDEQRSATGIVNAVTAEQIARSPDSDAAQAVQRVSGVTVQDGKYVVVRGLGERYTTTSLNGSRIPSAEPERKLVPFDLFPASLIEQITTSKTFTPDQPGDFSGAQVDIKTRELTTGNYSSFSLSTGFNTAVTGASMLAAPRSGREWLAFSSGAREQPRNVWSADREAALPNGSIGFAIGGAPRLQRQQINYLLSGTYSAGQEARLNEVRAQAQSAGDATVEIDRYEGSTARTSVLWGGVANMSTLFGARTRLAFNNTYNRSADNEARFEAGRSENLGGLPLQITRLRYVERAVRSHQVLGDHELSDLQSLSWSLSSSAVARVEPDRSEIVYALDSDPVTGTSLPAAWLASSPEAAVRTFGDLDESSWEFAAHTRRKVGASHAKIGVLGRSTDRDSENSAYSITAPMLSRAEREQSPEQIFAQMDTDGGRFRIAPLAQGGSYSAKDRLLAAYAMIDWTISDRATVTLGARVERSNVEVLAEPTVGAAITATSVLTDILPSLAVNFRAAEQHQLRFSATQTLSRPEYRELAGVQYREVIGGENVMGNPQLQRTLIRNLDFRYELYPTSGEMFSIAAFAKFFRNPIERIYLGTSGTRIVTFANADRATNVGVELEGRKRLGVITVFANATLMKSTISIGDALSGSSRVNDERPMVGQSPYVINAGIAYNPSPNQFSGTLLYNVFGKRIVSAAELPLPDVYELSRHSLDASLRMPVASSFSIKLDGKNLLDPRYEIVQGNTTRESYRTGRVLSVGVSWRR